jgi:predicted TIM-barrel fold metal-dependent hydrolase
VLWDAFGEDRLLFGSNWPVSAVAAPLSAVHRLAT